MKTVRRQIIIREYDYDRIVQLYIPILYTRASFVPFTLKDLEQERMLQVLSTPEENIEQIKYRIPDNYDYPRSFLWCLKDQLYNDKYPEWFSEYDENGYMWIQARKNTPKSKLGRATFEYDYG